MRLIVARCEVTYSGRLTTVLPEALRLLMIKADGSVLVHADTGGYKPLNWMTPPTVIERGEPPTRDRSSASAPARARTARDRAREVLSDVAHDMGEAARAREGRRRSATCRSCWPSSRDWCGEGFRLVRREWPTDIGPVDLMCRDERRRAGWRSRSSGSATIDAVEQLARYLERIRLDPATRGLPRRARRPADQAAGAGAGRVARHRLRRGRPRRPARRARARLTLFADYA